MMIAAAAWGAAEATLFFIVPDVLITWLAARQLRCGLRAAFFATGGSMLGGLLMFAWGRADPVAAWSVVECVPAVSVAMLEQVKADLGQHGLRAVFAGPLLGTPYKTYAVQAGILGLPAAPFLLVSIPARLLRFVLLAVAVAVLRRSFLSHWSQARFDTCLLGAWTAFYLAFLYFMPW